MATKHIIPGRIDDLLKQLGMTQKDFCASTKPHIDPATFKKARDGGPVRHEIAKRIATGFSIPLNTLVATVADGEPSTSDGSTTDHPYVFDEPNIHSGDCSAEPGRKWWAPSQVATTSGGGSLTSNASAVGMANPPQKTGTG